MEINIKINNNILKKFNKIKSGKSFLKIDQNQ